MQDTEYYSMMRKQYHNDSWEAKLKKKMQEKSEAEMGKGAECQTSKTPDVENSQKPATSQR